MFKINLIKEHIKKGCELIPDSEYNFRYDNLTFNSSGYSSPVNGGALYRDFLQLVIEGINSRIFEMESEFLVFQYAESIEVKNCETGVSKMIDWYEDRLNLTKAKEKAIAYVFDNMEG